MAVTKPQALCSGEQEAGRSPQHLASLDGLRGFAALSVLIFHLGHWFGIPGLASNASLAVDLFFCLSGFVLSLAYCKRRQSLSFSGFMRARLIRLMPLIVLGLVVSALYVGLRSGHLEGEVPFAALTLALLLGLVNLPYPDAPDAIGGPQVFPLNGPQYSLFLELVVNAFWWATRRVSQLPLAIALFLGCLAVLPFTGLGGDTSDTLWLGFPRVGASFFAGVAVFHLLDRLPGWLGGPRLFWTLAAGMAALFYLPFEVPLWMQLVWIAVLAPWLILAGARTALQGRLAAWSSLSGDLSYPVYCLHYPLFCWINGLYRLRFGEQNAGIEGPAVIVIVCVASFVLLKFYDEPLRRALAEGVRRWSYRPTSSAGA
ncbi:acyltransferase [Labrys sp. KNU-23]|nr:acyltransferase [Labrys sp. KNU-23]